MGLLHRVAERVRTLQDQAFPRLLDPVLAILKPLIDLTVCESGVTRHPPLAACAGND